MSKRQYNGFSEVIGVDLDGVLGQYHEHFLTFARLWLGLDPEAYWPGPKALRDHRTQAGYPLPWTDDGYGGDCPLNEYMGVTKATYRKVKLAYRQSGLKRSMRPYPGATELMAGLRRAGCWVVVCTTRPYLHLSNIEPDTLEFLRRNNMKFDDIIMGEHKYRTLRKRYKSVAAVLDDDPALLSQAMSVSPPIPALLMVRSHNMRHWEDASWWVNDCKGALDTLVEHVKRATWMLGIQPTNEEFGHEG